MTIGATMRGWPRPREHRGRARRARRDDAVGVEAGLRVHGARACPGPGRRRAGRGCGPSGRGPARRARPARCRTKPPKPPTAPSSTVTSASCSRASRSDQLDVERLGEAGVGDGGREAPRRQHVGGLQALGQARAEGQDGDGGALAHDAALADLQRLGDARDLDADALAARIAEGAGPVVDLRRRWRPCATSSASSAAAIRTMPGSAPR